MLAVLALAAGVGGGYWVGRQAVPDGLDPDLFAWGPAAAVGGPLLAAALVLLGLAALAEAREDKRL